MALKNSTNERVDVSGELGRQIEKALNLSHRVVIVISWNIGSQSHLLFEINFGQLVAFLPIFDFLVSKVWMVVKQHGSASAL